MSQQNRRVVTRGGYDDLENGMLGNTTAERSGSGPVFFMPKSSISIKTVNSPGTASKEDRRKSRDLYSSSTYFPGQQVVANSDEMQDSLSCAGDTGISNSSMIPNFIVVPVLVIIWYAFAVLAITTSKKIMNEVQLPNFLCTTQFVCALVATKFISQLTESNQNNTHKAHIGIPHHLLPTFNLLVAQIALSYSLGFIFTNMAFSVVTASFAETVKSAEPISSIALGYLVLNEVATLPTYLTLIPICLGVSISCIHDDSFNMGGFLYAAISNLCFSGRAVLAKRLLKQYPGSLDEVQLFHRVSLIGLYLLVPLTLLTEGRAILALFQGDATMVDTYLELLALVLVNGCAYACYNLMSFLVLSRTNLVTHAVLNCFRRVFIILFTSYYFNVEISRFNMAGVAMAVLGVCLFAFFRSRDSRPEKREA